MAANEMTSLFECSTMAFTHQEASSSSWMTGGITTTAAAGATAAAIGGLAGAGHRKSIYSSSLLLTASTPDYSVPCCSKTRGAPVIISPRAPMLEVLLNPIRSKFTPERVMAIVNDLDREVFSSSTSTPSPNICVSKPNRIIKG